MTDTSKGKVASLTGSLLARKGTATPAGFTRVVPGGEIDPPAPIVTVTGANATPEKTNHDQPSLNLGAGFVDDKDGPAEEGWAPLSQIVIRPHPFTSAETPPAPTAEITQPAAPIGDIGIEPSLLADPALLLPVTPLDGERGEHVTVETPLVSPALHSKEPILVVPRLQRDPAEEDGEGAPADVDRGEYEELTAPTLGPAVRGWEPEQAVPEDIPAAARARLDPAFEPSARPANEPHLAEPAQTAPPSLDQPSIKQSEEQDLPEPIVLPKPAPVLAPVVAKRTTARPEAAKPAVVPPIRIGELQARARVIPTRTRRRRRIGPVVFAILALALFLGVTWQAYRTSRDGDGIVSTVGPDGEPTIWATVDELGYAVSQILAAVTGRGGSDGADGSRLAVATDGIPPSSTFAPAGAVAPPAQSAEPQIADADPVEDGSGEATGETAAAEAEAKPAPEPIVVIARPASQEPLPAPPVPAAPVVKEETVAVAPLRPLGVTAPPPPPLNVDTAEAGSDGSLDTASPQGLEEVDTAIALEPLGPTEVAVAAGAPVASTPAPVTEVAALPVVSGADDGLGALGDIALEGAGVPVLKPAARLPQQSLSGASGLDTGGLGTSGPGDASGNAVDGYAVQLSSLKTRVQAEREFERLRGDYPALLREVELVVSEGSVSNRGTFFRILTSRFEDAGAAQVLCRSLQDRGQDCLVVRR